MTSPSTPVWATPIPQRAPISWRTLLLGILWSVAFNGGIFLTYGLQLVLYPLSLFSSTIPPYKRVTKGVFGQLCVFMTEWWAPTSFVISSDGMGDKFVKRDGQGRVNGLDLPKRSVWVSNHQTLADWIYVWSFSYLTSHHDSLVITLKGSIKAIPVIGWACSLYGFIFLARSWLTDKVPFKRQLVALGNEVHGSDASQDEKLALLIFPEGTLVTGNTRPKSKAFADKIGVPDFQHTLLPRSTGLFFALRILARTIPDLSLVDLTFGYPLSVPDSSKPLPTTPSSYPEDHYSLLVWFKAVPPPAIHVHVRQFLVKDEVPLGDLEATAEGTEEEKLVFDKWLRARWAEKDALMDKFVREGRFVDDGKALLNEKEVQAEKKKASGSQAIWPIRLRHWWEHGQAFSFFVPAFAAWLVVPWFFALVVGVLSSLFSGGGKAAVKETVQQTEATVKACCAGKSKQGGFGFGEL